MYALFLESYAAKQIIDRCAAHPELGGVNDVLKALYYNALVQHQGHHEPPTEEEVQEFDNWWVNSCLKGDKHKHFSVDSLCIWGGTPEGHAYWARIQNWGD